VQLAPSDDPYRDTVGTKLRSYGRFPVASEVVTNIEGPTAGAMAGHSRGRPAR